MTNTTNKQFIHIIPNVDVTSLWSEGVHCTVHRETVTICLLKNWKSADNDFLKILSVTSNRRSFLDLHRALHDLLQDLFCVRKKFQNSISGAKLQKKVEKFKPKLTFSSLKLAKKIAKGVTVEQKTLQRKP